MKPESHPAALSRPSGRLHPWTLLFELLGVARQLLIPLLYWVISDFSIFGALLVLVFGLLSLLLTIARYRSFRYRVAADELVIEQGLLRHQERHIPLANIQEIRLEQNLIQRWLGVARADIETSTGNGVEASLAVLAVSDIAHLRRSVFGVQAAAAVSPVPAPDAAETPLLALSPRALLAAGLTSNSIFTLFLALGALFRFAEEWLPEDKRRAVWHAIADATRALGQQSPWTAAALLACWAGALLLLSVTLSGLLSLVRFYDFRLTQQGAALRRTYGLFTRHVSNLSPARIQLIAVEQTVLRRLCGWAALRVEVASVTYERQEERQGRGLLAPLVRSAEVNNLLRRFLADDLPDERAWRSVSPLAVRRGILRRLGWLIPAAVICWWWWTWLLGWLVLVGLPVIVLVSRLDSCARGYIATPRYWFVRQGWANRVIHVVPVQNIQTVVIRQTPFDRRLGLATLILDTAGPTPVVIRDVPATETEALGRCLARQAETLAWETGQASNRLPTQVQPLPERPASPLHPA